MQEKLYTLEGNEYRVKTQSNSFVIGYAALKTVSKYVFINNPTGSAADVESIKFETSKNIIPVSYSASAVDAGNNVIADIANCYFAVQAGGLNFLPTYRNTLAKIYPYVQRVYYTDENNNNFISRYNQVILSKDDFISVSDPLAISFFASLANAMTRSDASFTPESFDLPIGVYVLTFTFTYLELQ